MAARNAQKRYESRKCAVLERLVKHPEKWWKLVKKLRWYTKWVIE